MTEVKVNDQPRSAWWGWDGIIHKKICTDTIKQFDVEYAALQKPGTIVRGDVNKEVRDCSIVWFPRMCTVESILSHFSREANYGANWHLDLSIVCDQLQVAKYEANGHYDTHNDLYPYTGSNLERKITAVMLLSDPKTYEGGDLIVGYETVAFKKQGSVITFPSYMPHQVTPVTKGVRYSATLWITGPRFK